MGTTSRVSVFQPVSEQHPLIAGNANAWNRRGINIFALTELVEVTGQDMRGNRMGIEYEIPLFGLALDERIDIFKKTAPVFGLVTGRMNRIAGLEWNVVNESKEVDRIADMLKEWRSIAQEYAGGTPLELGLNNRLWQAAQTYLFDLKPDWSNFSRSLLRWERREKGKQEDYSTEIEDWLAEPNPDYGFEAFQKQTVFDLLVHGSVAIYKEPKGGEQGAPVDNLYVLPGGTVSPGRNRFVGGATAYAQIVVGMDPLIMFKDEVAYRRYVPTSAEQYGMVPLDALVNKIVEYLLFDRLAAERSDGTKPPEKLVVMGETSPFGNIGAEFNTDVPLDREEVRRMQTIMNEEIKDAVRVLSGVGTPAVVDLSRADTFQAQSSRQIQIREDIGLVFNISNTEMNLTGSEDTSGRATSESQERIDQAKGIFPLVAIIEDIWNRDIIPMRFGPGYKLRFQPQTSEAATVRDATNKLKSGLFAINEIRTRDLGEDPFDGEEFDQPPGATVEGPFGQRANPLLTGTTPEPTPEP